MSKQSEAKSRQGYVDKPVPQICKNCIRFLFDRVQTHEPTEWNKNGFWQDKNLRCRLGDFAVKKTATCGEFLAKET